MKAREWSIRCFLLSGLRLEEGDSELPLDRSPSGNSMRAGFALVKTKSTGCSNSLSPKLACGVCVRDINRGADA